MKAPFRLRIVADLHVGSRYGLWPPAFTREGQTYTQNRYQQFLWACWQTLHQAPIPDLVVVNGDVVDGNAPKDHGIGTMTTDADVQAEAAVEVLRAGIGKTPCWLVRGTPYHERTWAALGAGLHAQRWPDGDASGTVLDLVVRGTTINFAHHPEGGAVLYKGTSLDKTGLWAVIAGALGKVPLATVIVRSHWHFYGLLQSNGRTVIQTPCLQVQTPYAMKLAYFRHQPDLGWVDLVLDRDEPYPTVQPVLFPIPLRPPVQVP